MKTWKDEFERLWREGVKRYQAGGRGAANLFSDEDAAAMARWGYTRQELYDFCEDFANYGEPSYETALAIAGVRKDYFEKVQHQDLAAVGKDPVDMASLPAKTDAVEGIEWLPRLIQKARAKLAGRMPDDLMYGCGGDRRFFREHQIDPADFLRQVWQSDSDDRAVVQYVQSAGKGK